MTMVHLPGLNTPQFEHCRSKMPYKPQPVPPIFEPEIAADAIVWATHHRRRAVYVGSSTVATILGNRVAASFVEWYLARTGYSGQQTSQPEPGVRAGNLFEPVQGDPGAHGPFDARSHEHSAQLAATKHRRLVGALGLGAGVLAGTLAAVLRS